MRRLYRPFSLWQLRELLNSLWTLLASGLVLAIVVALLGDCLSDTFFGSGSCTLSPTGRDVLPYYVGGAVFALAVLSALRFLKLLLCDFLLCFDQAQLR